MYKSYSWYPVGVVITSIVKNNRRVDFTEKFDKVSALTKSDSASIFEFPCNNNREILSLRIVLRLVYENSRVWETQLYYASFIS